MKPAHPRFPDPAKRAAAAAPPVEGPAELVRLNKFLAERGIASRRHADELIRAGKVSVDGEVVLELGLRIDPARQEVDVDGVRLKHDPGRRRTYLLNKPKGVLCTSERRELRPRAIDLITDPEKGRIFTVGRLDEESQGLILLTNDGELANLVSHPRYGVWKTYLAKVRGRIEGEALERLRQGVHLAEGRTGGARVRVRKRATQLSIIEVTLREGKNREVRRIFAQVGFNVLALKRTHIGPLTDRRLKEGQWRPLLKHEIEQLRAAATPAGAGPAEGGEELARAPERGPRAYGPGGGARRRPPGRVPGRAPRKPKPRGGAREQREQREQGRAVSRPPGRRQRGGSR